MTEACKDGILRPGADHNRCTWACGDGYRLDCFWNGICLKVILVDSILEGQCRCTILDRLGKRGNPYLHFEARPCRLRKS